VALKLKRTEGVAFVVTLAGLAAVTATAVDIFLPAQPMIGSIFGLPSGAGGVLIAAYFLGYGPGMMLWGPLADRYGRLPPLYISLIAFVVLAVVCATTDSFEVLVAARGLQGVAGGGGPVIARAIARDMGGGARTVRLLTTMTAIFSAAPLLSPIVGSGLLMVFEWPSVFWALVVFGALLILATVLFIPETRPRTTDGAQTPPSVLNNLGILLRARDFNVGMFLTTTVFAGYAVLLSIGASVAEKPYGIPPQLFGFLFAVAAVASVTGSVSARFMATRLGLERVISTGTAIVGVAGAGFLIIGAGTPSLPVLWVVVACYLLGFGMLFPTGTAKSLGPAGRMAGLGASVLGAVQMLTGAAAAALGAVMFDSTNFALSTLMGAAGLLCLVIRAIDMAAQRNTKTPST
tara:strand:- start:5440 stop:6654 length:1215 start_codon:yes stop_codon:yes gene_type:complete